MKYYYDITLNFNEYPINYYEWEKDDDIERFIKIKVIKVDDVKDFILYNMDIELDDDVYVLSDGVNSVAIEVISKHIAYISSLTYEDELNVCNLAKKMEVQDIKYKIIDKRKIIHELRNNIIIKKCLLNTIKESNEYLLKYMYLEVTDHDSNDLDKIKKYLVNDINNNLSDKYIELYRKIIKKNI